MSRIAMLDRRALLPELPLRIFNFRQPNDIPHTHLFHELVLVRRGRGMHLTANGGSPIRRGDVLLIPPGVRHTYEDTEKLEIANILFIPEELSLPLAELAETAGYRMLFPAASRFSGSDKPVGTLSLDDAQLRRAEGEMSAMLIEQQRRNPGWSYFLRFRFMTLIGQLCRAHPEETTAGDDELDRLTRVTDYIEIHYAEPLTLDTLAAIGGCSRCTLIRMFRRAFHRPPIGYLLDLRLERAAKELRITGHPIAEVAMRHGFPDSNYFTKLFQRRYGVSPRAYRKRPE